MKFYGDVPETIDYPDVTLYEALMQIDFPAAAEEIILAAGALCMRIFGTHENISRADAHLQTYRCGLVRRALEDALA